MCWIVSILLSAGLSAEAQESAAKEPPVAVYVFTLNHQPASEAIPLVRPLLSHRGSVELRPGGNTLVIRDVWDSLQVIRTVIRSYDHPLRSLGFQLYLMEATRATVSGAPSVGLPELLAERLGAMLRYDTYQLLAEANLEAREGEEVTCELGQEYQVSFRVGTVLGEKRVRLVGFRVTRRESETDEAKQMIHTNLNPFLQQTLTLVLASSEFSARALVVAVHVAQPVESQEDETASP